MMDAKTLERLHNSRDFLAFLEAVMEAREQYVRNLHDLDTARLQQISGRILAYDDVCATGKLDELREKWRKLEQ